MSLMNIMHGKAAIKHIENRQNRARHSMCTYDWILVNDTDVVLNVYLLDYEGNLNEHPPCQPGCSLLRYSFVAHTWIIKDGVSGNTISAFVLTEQVPDLTYFKFCYSKNSKGRIKLKKRVRIIEYPMPEPEDSDYDTPFDQKLKCGVHDLNRCEYLLTCFDSSSDSD